MLLFTSTSLLLLLFISNMFRYYFVALYYAAELLWNVDEAKMIDGCVLIPASRTLNFYACVSYLARLTLTGTNFDVFR